MIGDKPTVSIGLPVFNGQKYLREALDSILGQTFADFELIISDNASTDGTQEICRAYATREHRIHYFRNERNLGACRNFNRVFELSSGLYFKWAAYDDLHAPEFLQKCVSVLEKDPSIVLCYSKTSRIDEYGRRVDNYGYKMRIDSWKPHERFGDLISIHNPCWSIYGVIRRNALLMTPLLGNYIAADRSLLAELGLIGRMYEIPEYLFFRRDHPDAYTYKYYDGQRSLPNYQKQSAWWGRPERVGLPNWKICFEYFRSVRRSQLGWRERFLCYNQIGRWVTEEGWTRMGSDLENVLLNRSNAGRRLTSSVNSILRRITDSEAKEKNVKQ